MLDLTAVVTKLIESDIRLDDPRIKACKVTKNFNNFYRFKDKDSGQVTDFPAKDFCDKYFELKDSIGVTAFEL